MTIKLIESVKKCTFGLHLSIFVAEILMFALIMTVLKNDRSNFNQNNGIYKLMRQKRSMLRYKRFLQESRLGGLAPYTRLSRNFTPCRSLHHYWSSVCAENNNLNAHVPQKHKRNFIQDTLQHFSTYPHKVRANNLRTIDNIDQKARRDIMRLPVQCPSESPLKKAS